LFGFVKYLFRLEGLFLRKVSFFGNCLLCVTVAYHFGVQNNSVCLAESDLTLSTDVLNQGVSLNDVLTLVEENNFELLSNKKEVRMAHWDVQIARRFPNPQFTGNFSQGNIVRRLGNAQQIGFNQLLELGFKRKRRTEFALAQSFQTNLEYKALRWEIRAQVRKAYAQVIAAEQQVLLLDNQALLLDKLVDIARKRYKAGVASGAELHQALLSRAQINTQKNQALGEVEQAHNNLNSLLGNHLPRGFEVSDQGLFRARIQKSDHPKSEPAKSEPAKSELVPAVETSLPDLNLLQARALEERPDLKALAQEKVVFQKQLLLTKAMRIPDLQFSGGYLLARAPSPEGPIRHFSGPFIVTTFEVPIFHNQGAEIAKINLTLDQNQLRQLDLRRQIQLETDNAYAALKASRMNIVIFQNNLLPEAQKVVQLAQKSYASGKTPLANFILAQQSLQQVSSEYTQTLVNYQYAWGNLEKAVGAPLNDW
jgi:outer membrane protein, heavy metal efflux system